MSTAQQSRRLISTVHTTCVASSVRISCHSAVTTASARRVPLEKADDTLRRAGNAAADRVLHSGALTGRRGDTIVTAPASRRPERSIVRGISTFSVSTASAPGRTRTGNLRIRRPMLYPLSYGGVREAPHQPTPSTRWPRPRREGHPSAVVSSRRQSREDHVTMTRTHRSERVNGSAQPRR